MHKMVFNIKVSKSVGGIISRWKTRDKQALCVVIANLLSTLPNNTGVVYSRDSSARISPERYNKKQISNRSIMKSIDYLVERNLVINTVAPRQPPKRSLDKQEFICSHIIATPLFISTFKNEKIEGIKHSAIVDEEQVVLKDLDKNVIDYIECDLSLFSRLCLNYYNTYISKQVVSMKEDNLNCILTRIFNGEIGDTGRLYRSAVQSLTKEDRCYLLINNQSTIELDYSCLHLNMLIDINKCGEYIENIPDAYMLPLPEELQENLYNREAVKKAFNLMLNCRDRKTANAVVQQYLNIQNKHSDFKSGAKLLDCIIEGYSFLPLPLILWQSKPMAYKLQRMDSDIALEIITTLAEKDVPVLPIHDSFITTVDNYVLLQSVMGNIYRKYLGVDKRVPITACYQGQEWKEYV